MLVIRLQPVGRRNSPAYRLVVADKKAAVQGKSLENLGHYVPTRDPAVFIHDDAKIAAWIAKGACPSDTVARLLSRAGMKNLDRFIKRYAKKKCKNPTEEPAAAA